MGSLVEHVSMICSIIPWGTVEKCDIDIDVEMGFGPSCGGDDSGRRAEGRAVTG